MIRFHLDENVDPAIARALLFRGIDVTTAANADLLSASDDEQLIFAASDSRVLVTHDADFLRRHAAGTPHAGICYCHMESRTVGEIVRSLVMIHECLEPEDLENHVEWI